MNESVNLKPKCGYWPALQGVMYQLQKSSQTAIVRAVSKRIEGLQRAKETNLVHGVT